MNSTEKAFVFKFFAVRKNEQYELFWNKIEPVVQKHGFKVVFDWFEALEKWFNDSPRNKQLLEALDRPGLLWDFGEAPALPSYLYRGIILKNQDRPPDGTPLMYGTKYRKLSGWSPLEDVASSFIQPGEIKQEVESGLLLRVKPSTVVNIQDKIIWAPPRRDTILRHLQTYQSWDDEQEWILNLEDPIAVECVNCPDPDAAPEKRELHVFQEEQLDENIEPALRDLIEKHFRLADQSPHYNPVAKALLATRKPVPRLNGFLTALEGWFTGTQDKPAITRDLLKYRDVYQSFGFKIKPPAALHRGLLADPAILPKNPVEKFYYGSKYKRLSGWSEDIRVAKRFAGGGKDNRDDVESDQAVILSLNPGKIPGFLKKVIWAPPPKGSLFDYHVYYSEYANEKEWILDCTEPLPVAECKGCISKNVNQSPRQKQVALAMAELWDGYNIGLPISDKTDKFLDSLEHGLARKVSAWVTDVQVSYGEETRAAKNQLKKLLIQLEKEMESEDEMNEQKNITIDLGLGRKQQLNEFTLTAMGSWITFMIQKMFGWPNMPNFTIKGSQSEIEKFGHAVTGEKRYMDSFKKFGLDNPKTLQDKYQLEKAVNEFERETGLQWPFK